MKRVLLKERYVYFRKAGSKEVDFESSILPSQRIFLYNSLISERLGGDLIASRFLLISQAICRNIYLKQVLIRRKRELITARVYFIETAFRQLAFIRILWENKYSASNRFGSMFYAQNVAPLCLYDYDTIGIRTL